MRHDTIFKHILGNGAKQIGHVSKDLTFEHRAIERSRERLVMAIEKKAREIKQQQETDLLIQLKNEFTGLIIELQHKEKGAWLKTFQELNVKPGNKERFDVNVSTGAVYEVETNSYE